MCPDDTLKQHMYVFSTTERPQYPLFFKVKSSDINLLTFLSGLFARQYGRFNIMIGQNHLSIKLPAKGEL